MRERKCSKFRMHGVGGVVHGEVCVESQGRCHLDSFLVFRVHQRISDMQISKSVFFWHSLSGISCSSGGGVVDYQYERFGDWLVAE